MKENNELRRAHSAHRPKSAAFVLVVAFVAITISGCGWGKTCATREDAAKHLAAFSADVQAASLKGKLPMSKLKYMTEQLERASNGYNSVKDPNEFCEEIDNIRNDIGL